MSPSPIVPKLRTEPLQKAYEGLSAPAADPEKMSVPDLGPRNTPREMDKEIARSQELGGREKTVDTTVAKRVKNNNLMINDGFVWSPLFNFSGAFLMPSLKSRYNS